MLLRPVAALLIVAGAVNAFKDASPLWVYSSNPSGSEQLQSQQIATSHDVEEKLLASLPDCSNTNFLLLSQPGLKAADFAHLPSVRRHAEGTNSHSMVEIPEVIGDIDLERVAARISKTCDININHWVQADESVVGIPVYGLPSLEGTENDSAVRNKELEHTDVDIEILLAKVSKRSLPYVIIYTASSSGMRSGTEPSHQHPPYEMDEPYPSGFRTDLKRDLEQHKRSMRNRRQSNSTDNAQAGLPLFEQYQFLSPSIFMGLFVSLVLFLILYVGVTAIAGLEVSYKAFDKEMGPQAQNRNKQQ